MEFESRFDHPSAVSYSETLQQNLSIHIEGEDVWEAFCPEQLAISEDVLRVAPRDLMERTRRSHSELGPP